MEVYFRSAEKYLDVLHSEGQFNLFVSKHSEALKDKDIGHLIEGVYGSIEPVSVILVGDDRKYITKDGGKYPIFRYGDPFRDLKEMKGEWVFLMGCPSYYHRNRPTVRKWLEGVNKHKPEGMKVHLTGGHSAQLVLENNVDAFDFNPYWQSQQKCAILPNGKLIRREKWNENRKWIRVVGYKLEELDKFENLLRFNVKSTLAIAKEEVSPFEKPQPAVERSLRGYRHGGPQVSKEAKKRGEQIKKYRREQVLCDMCISHCDMFAEGEVCTRNKEFKSLSSLYNTRSTELIEQGLISTIASQADRYAFGRADEKKKKMLFKEVTNIENSLIKNGIELLKILNPSLRPVSNKLIMENPNILASIMVKAADEKGVGRDNVDAGKVLREVTNPGG